MNVATYKIAEQIGNHGIYGEIEMLVSFNDDKDRRLNLTSLDQQFKKWEPGVVFGATYIIEHCTKAISLNITVTDIKFNDVDTTNVVIAYITYNAILSAIGLQLSSNIYFDKQKILFEFEK